MRSLAITSALAALSLITGAAADTLAGNDLIFGFDVFNDANCGIPRSDLLTSRAISDNNVGNLVNGPKCLFFSGADTPDDAGAVIVNGLRDGCRVFLYPDEGCQDIAAAPLLGECAFNVERFRSFAVTCDGHFLQTPP